MSSTMTSVAFGQAGGMKFDVLFAAVPVADLEASRPWYERLFGRVADIVPNEDEVMWNVSTDGWVYVVRDAERAGRTMVTLSVPDLDAAVAELAGHGLRSGPIEMVGDAGRKATVKDPDGNSVAIIEVGTAGR